MLRLPSLSVRGFLKSYHAGIGRCLGAAFGGSILSGGQGRIKWPLLNIIASISRSRAHVPRLRSDVSLKDSQKTVHRSNYFHITISKRNTRRKISGHGATFRCIFGTDCQVTFDKSTAERIKNVPTDVESKTHASLDPILDAHIYSCPMQERPDQCFIDVPADSLEVERRGTAQYKPGDDRNVRRMHLAEVRITVFHANSSSWIHAHTETRHHLGKLIYSAIIDQSDYIVGDGNKFAQMNFKEDAHSDYRTCIIVDMLCRILKNINSTRRYEDRITNDIVSLISHYEWLAGSIGKECDPDCLICISLHYGKQQVMKIARCKEPTYSKTYPYEGFPNRREVIMIDKERPKYFKPIDIGLRSGDCDFHSPLLVTGVRGGVK